MAYPVVSDARVEAAVRELLLAARPFDQLVCRTASRKWANPRDLTSGSGASHEGRRWNPAGVRAVYFGLDQTTAAAESDPTLRMGASPGSPRIIEAWHIRVTVERCAPIENNAVLKALGLSLADLFAEPYAARITGSGASVSQRIGVECVRQGLNAIEYPSQRNKPSGRCIVIFPDVAPAPVYEFPPETREA